MRLFFGIIFLTANLLTAFDVSPDYLLVQYGPKNTTKKLHTQTLDLIAGYQLPKKNPNKSIFFMDIEVGVSGFKSNKQQSLAGKKVVIAFSGSAIFQWILPKERSFLQELPFRPWVQIGSGPLIFTSKKVPFRYDHPLSTHLQFASQFGFGARLGKSEKVDLGLLFKHISNANLELPNSGYDAVLLGMRYWF